jgi:hypothetical protein
MTSAEYEEFMDDM